MPKCHAPPVQFIPATVMSVRASVGSANPGIVIIPAVLSSFVAVTVGVIACKILERRGGKVR